MTAPPLGICCRGTIAKVNDGDTLIFLVFDVIPVSIRLRDCWAAETLRAKTPVERRLGEAAGQALRDFAEGEPGVLSINTVDARKLKDILTIDRVLGDVWLADDPDVDLATWMRRGNFAFRTKVELGEYVKSMETAALGDPTPPSP